MDVNRPNAFSHPLGCLSALPSEVLTIILKEVGDWNLTAALEAIQSGLPRLFQDPFQALSSLNIVSTFPATCHLIRRRDDLDGPLSLLQVVLRTTLIPEFEPREMILDNADSLKILQYLHQRPDSAEFFDTALGPYPKLMDLVADQGNLEIFTWLHLNRPEGCTSNALDRAAAAGHLHLVRYIHENEIRGWKMDHISRDFYDNEEDLATCTMDAMDMAAANGHFEIVKFLNENRNEGCSYGAVNGASEAGHLEMVKYLMDRHLKDRRLEDFTLETARKFEAEGDWDLAEMVHDLRKISCHPEEVLTAAAEGGHLDLVKMIYGQRDTWPEDEVSRAFDQAARHGRLETARFLREKKPSITSVYAAKFSGCHEDLDMLALLTENPNETIHFSRKTDYTPEGLGCFDAVRYLHEHRGIEIDVQIATDHAAIEGRADMLRYLHEKWSKPVSLQAMNEAILRGHFQVVKYLHEIAMLNFSENALIWFDPGNDPYVQFPVPLDDRKKQHFEVIQFLNEHGYGGFTKRTMDSAAFAGRLDILQYLHKERGEGCSTDAMDRAAEAGHLDVVLFLHYNRSEGCTTRAMDSAAREGHLEIVTFLNEQRDEGCTTDAMDGAAEAGFLDIVSYLHHHRFEGCTARAMDRAAECGHLDVVKFLHRHRNEGCTTDAMDLAAGEGHLDVVKYLNSYREEGCTTAAIDLAAEEGHLDVVKYLHANRREGCTTAAIDNAAGMGHFAVVKYLQEEVGAGCTVRAVTEAAIHGYFDIARYLQTFINFN
ncbi:hypothetical protein HDU97_001555 [Phlyctochytrium planicorne]|nr:hypothetical protein HDU97_001555 [Phlyctochytrium planicorne]